jgi:rhodanese-related sulfurtransferase
MRTRLLRMTLITALGATTGLLWNSMNGKGFDLSRSVLVQAGDELVQAPEARARLDAGALFLDARPRDFWRMNRIPGALPLPEDDFDAALAEVEPELQKTTNIVVYCSGYGCEASHIVARRLRERGYPAVILDEGLPAWEDEGYALDTEARP